MPSRKSADKASKPASLVDIQASPDERGIPLRQVGVTKLRYPMVVWDRANQRQGSHQIRF